ncbi:MAG TPA: FlgD immunoglobulin-like domain containing protein [candidate division Zixibacteria bacterium]|nr:T9SS type A sorting domain-containing protein [candidate division Zixibacteria bacterium]MDD4917146.1 FlgD immunoglobulin-like domain containing protein [candidate division Zixibacteria bacterium]MDM7972670.1 FlgD immunoglobulin-like domain containing protein [candidate division Zixibacteria bacterium]HOD65414.1 FlgD immunoglobulin-like domain containing protein [candidate division Zixibacteria bacterium]HOZ06907.1 FlgD immunoglobulin-like domain containing protein [candidate division Zixiba
MFRLIAVVMVSALVAAAAPAAGTPGRGSVPTVTVLPGAGDTLPVTPTYEWIDIYCGEPTLDGAPLAPGDTIFVYDPDNMCCGAAIVHADGMYGFAPVYRDDAYSAEDEGAEPGDTLRFVVNGVPVAAAPPVIWTANGESFAVCRFLTAPPAYREVSLDIKPGSCPNPLNLVGPSDNGKAVLPAAVLGAPDFDVRTINPPTLALGGAEVVRWSYEDVGRPKADPYDTCACHEYGPDGYMDLTLKFYRAEVAPAVSFAADGDYAPLVLTGSLLDGTPLSGVDCVRVQRGGRPEGNSGGGPTGKVQAPADFALANHPNPFNPSTQITFALPQAGPVTLRVYDVQGRLVRTLANGPFDAGVHSVEWNGTDGTGSAVASGVYLYRLSAGETVVTRKMILMK